MIERSSGWGERERKEIVEGEEGASGFNQTLSMSSAVETETKRNEF
jgi:hypothetical protein